MLVNAIINERMHNSCCIMTFQISSSTVHYGCDMCDMFSYREIIYFCGLRVLSVLGRV